MEKNMKKNTYMYTYVYMYIYESLAVLHKYNNVNLPIPHGIILQ